MSEEMKPTPHLRFERRHVAPYPGGPVTTMSVLQQRWDGHRSTQEWRDIPRVDAASETERSSTSAPR